MSTSLKSRLQAVLSTGGILDNFTNPGISIDAIDDVRIPLSAQDARILIEKSRRAPFGKGSETLVDVSVRRTWEIDAARVHFHNERWQHCLNHIVEKVARELGLPRGREVYAELYKMLLYEEGAMFKAHQELV